MSALLIIKISRLTAAAGNLIEHFLFSHPTTLPVFSPARSLLSPSSLTEHGLVVPPPLLRPAPAHDPPLNVIVLLLQPRCLLFLLSLSILVDIKAGQTTTSQEVLDEVPELRLLLVLGDDLLLHPRLVTILPPSQHSHLMAHTWRLQTVKLQSLSSYIIGYYRIFTIYRYDISVLTMISGGAQVAVLTELSCRESGLLLVRSALLVTTETQTGSRRNVTIRENWEEEQKNFTSLHCYMDFRQYRGAGTGGIRLSVLLTSN